MNHAFISSVNRNNQSASPAEFTVQLPNVISGSFCDLDFAMIPNTYYNITSSNNSFALNGGANIIIAAGNYSLKTLITAIQSTVGANYTVSYNPVTNLVGISSATSPLTPFTLTPGTLFKVLGFTQASYANVISVYGELAPKIYDTCVFINISLGANSQANIPFTGITFPVPNNANPGDLIQFYANSHFCMRLPLSKTEITNVVKVKIFDERGNLLQGLSDWSFQISY